MIVKEKIFPCLNCEKDTGCPNKLVCDRCRVMKNKVKNKEMKDYHINIFYSEEDEGYIADIPDLVSCSAFGNTPEEALKEVQLAKEAWLIAAKEEGKPVPIPAYKPVIYQIAS